MLENLITVVEATARYGLSGSYIRRLAREGRIEGRRMGNSWVIVPETLENYLETERRKKRPPIDR